jgi:hypothetical protein
VIVRDCEEKKKVQHFEMGKEKELNASYVDINNNDPRGFTLWMAFLLRIINDVEVK